jgi:hypothetical protein
MPEEAITIKTTAPITGTFCIGQDTCCGHATMGREPGAGVMQVLEGQAGTFNVQNVANTLWAACVLSIFRAPVERSRWVHSAATGVPGQDFVLQCHRIVPAPSVFCGMQRGRAVAYGSAQGFAVFDGRVS